MVENMNVAALPRKVFTVDLVGVEYQARAPKKAKALALMMQGKNAEASEDPTLMNAVIDSVVISMLGRDFIEPIHARLEDDDDQLDIDHLFQLMNKLIAAATGDPTT
jgi:hypothetical protein